MIAIGNPHYAKENELHCTLTPQTLNPKLWLMISNLKTKENVWDKISSRNLLYL
jgi:hypothetical protein